jgi:drug/metabolite transporter (DMT)-like permease
MQALFLVGTGLVSGVAQLMMTQAYRSGETTVVAPFEYVSILWAVAVGWLIWGEAPDISMLGGVAVLVASGLYILHREVVRRRERAA